MKQQVMELIRSAHCLKQVYNNINELYNKARVEALGRHTESNMEILWYAALKKIKNQYYWTKCSLKKRIVDCWPKDSNTMAEVWFNTKSLGVVFRTSIGPRAIDRCFLSLNLRFAELESKKNNHSKTLLELLTRELPSFRVIQFTTNVEPKPWSHGIKFSFHRLAKATLYSRQLEERKQQETSDGAQSGGTPE